MVQNFKILDLAMAKVEKVTITIRQCMFALYVNVMICPCRWEKKGPPTFLAPPCPWAWNLDMGNLKLTRQNLGRLLSSRCGRACACHVIALITKTIQLKV
jgi:hypothetical protein